MQVPESSHTVNELRQMSADQLKQFSQKRSLQFEELTTRIKTFLEWSMLAESTYFLWRPPCRSPRRFVIEGQPVPLVSARPFAEIRTVSVGYFAAMGIPLLKGRLFTAQDWALPRVCDQ